MKPTTIDRIMIRLCQIAWNRGVKWSDNNRLATECILEKDITQALAAIRALIMDKIERLEMHFYLEEELTAITKIKQAVDEVCGSKIGRR